VGSGLRAALLLLLLGLLAIQTAPPWAALWLAVPASAGVALLAAWRFGATSLAIPLVLAGVAVALGGPLGLWAWWLPAAAWTGAWMGLTEERGPGLGEVGFMLAPVLLLAAVLPFFPSYGHLVANVNTQLHAGDAEFLSLSRRLGYSESQWSALERNVNDAAALRTKALPNVLPTVLFLWVAVLVSAGRSFASLIAGLLRWPALSRPSLRDWRLPDAGIWVLMAGIAILLLEWPSSMPTGWTLLLNAGLGFCIQGIAVVESLLLARGMPPSIILLLMLFVSTVALPLFTVTTVALGLSDVWLDYRRLEPVAEDDTP